MASMQDIATKSRSYKNLELPPPPAKFLQSHQLRALVFYPTFEIPIRGYFRSPESCINKFYW